MESSVGTAITAHGLIDSFRADKLNVYVYDSRPRMGAAAAAVVAGEIRGLIETRGRAVGIFASAPSQNEFLAALVETSGIDWSRVLVSISMSISGWTIGRHNRSDVFSSIVLSAKWHWANFTGCGVRPRMEWLKANVIANSLRLTLPTSPCLASARMVIWPSLIHRSAISTIRSG